MRCWCGWLQRMQRREQFDVLLKEREQARVAALQKYVCAVSSSAPSANGGVDLSSLYTPSAHGSSSLQTGSASLLMLAAADRA